MTTHSSYFSASQSTLKRESTIHVNAVQNDSKSMSPSHHAIENGCQVDKKSIRAIDEKSVLRICSGQVIVSVSSAVKELVENSLDSHADVIDVLLKDYGLKSIEVSDNGSGINEDDFPYVAKAHCTSKINDFEDLPKIGSFGFRGEALSALCSLGDLTIITSQSSGVSLCSRLKYDAFGNILSKEKASRSRGTTVTVENLFGKIPVRQKEFTRHQKRELEKVLSVLQSYAIISLGVRLSVYHQIGNLPKELLIRTTVSNNLRERSVSIFGPSLVSSLTEIDWTFTISKKGRNDDDDEELILEKQSEFDEEFGHFSFNSSEKTQIERKQEKGEDSQTQYSYVIRGLITSQNGTKATTMSSPFSTPYSSTSKFVLFTNGRPVDFPVLTRTINSVFKSCNGDGMPSGILNIILPPQTLDFNLTPDKRTIMINEESQFITKVKDKLSAFWLPLLSLYPIQPLSSQKSKRNTLTKDLHPKSLSSSVIDLIPTASSIAKSLSDISSDFGKQFDKDDAADIDFHRMILNDVFPSNEDENQNDSRKEEAFLMQDDVPLNSPKIIANSVVVDIDHIIASFQKIDKKPERNAEDTFSKFFSILGSTKDADCVDELYKTLTKESFTKMQIIGQFNLGFILTRLDNDLFIIDQHASDEIYNFETLQKTIVMNSQQLLTPLVLELTPEDEIIVSSSLEVFARNGFKIKFDSSAPPGRKTLLLSHPFSKKTSFGPHDIHELIAYLRTSVENDPSNSLPQQTATSVPILSRVYGMIASRACRRSVMIGDQLSKQQMQKIVLHMSSIERPWNCPHGRPTMRHLIDLRKVCNFESL